ncbi:MAG TPA: hypothetical protein VIO60_00440 [Rectinemataceae bacterium]
MEPFIVDLDAYESLAFHRLVFKVFKRPRDYGFESQDEAAEAFLRYTSRIGTILKKSKTMLGKSDAYVDTCIRYLAKSLKRSARKKELLEKSLEVFATPQTFIQTCAEVEPPMDKEENVAPAPGFIQGLSASERRQLYLAVKCAWEIDDSLVTAIGEKLGLSPSWLRELFHRARSRVEAQMRALECYKQRKNSLWVKICLLDSRLTDPTLSQEEHRLLEERRQRYRRLYFSIQERINKRKLLVSNRDIASMLGVPKGSVDSGLYYLKRQNGRKTIQAS